MIIQIIKIINVPGGGLDADELMREFERQSPLPPSKITEIDDPMSAQPVTHSLLVAASMGSLDKADRASLDRVSIASSYREDRASIASSHKEDRVSIASSHKEDQVSIASSHKEDRVSIASSHKDDRVSIASSHKEDRISLASSNRDDLASIASLLKEDHYSSPDQSLREESEASVASCDAIMQALEAEAVHSPSSIKISGAYSSETEEIVNKILNYA